MNIKTPFAIFAVERSDVSDDQNIQRNAFILRSLDVNKIAYKQLVGTYKGVNEVSYLVQNIEFAESMGRIFDQECILISDANGLCSLDAQDGTSTVIGRMIDVDAQTAKASDASTFDPSTGRYFIVK